METSGLLVVQYHPRDEWSFATMRPGAPSVMDSGQPMMPMWPADNWDMLPVVCVCGCVCCRQWYMYQHTIDSNVM